MLGGVLTHAVLSCRVLSIFLYAVHCGIGDHAGNLNFVVSCAVASPALLANTNNARDVIAILNFILNLQSFDLRSETTDQKLV